MSDPAHHDISALIGEIYTHESRRVLATLIRLLGDFDRAEEALHDAFRAALETWPRTGVPAQPRAWLVSTGRFKAIDELRRRARSDATHAALADHLALEAETAPSTDDDESLVDDQLRLIFTCCHPALAPDAQMALTLREVCGLTTEAIAAAFLSSAPTVAQRIVRAKAKIRDAVIPYRIPTESELPGRLESVLLVIYLMFNEGYSASSGEDATRPDLSREAVRLGRLLATLLPVSEAQGLLGLMLLHESRRETRTSREGNLVLLEQQDRSQWNQSLIAEGIALVHQALARSTTNTTTHVGPYALQAAIAALHAETPHAAATDWREIVGLYDILLTVSASPVVALNRAVAVAMLDGPAAGLALIDALIVEGELADYHLVHAARADLFRRLHRWDDAARAYEEALASVRQAPERRFLEQRLHEMRAHS